VTIQQLLRNLSSPAREALKDIAADALVEYQIAHMDRTLDNDPELMAYHQIVWMATYPTNDHLWKRRTWQIAQTTIACESIDRIRVLFEKWATRQQALLLHDDCVYDQSAVRDLGRSIGASPALIAALA